MDANAIKEKRQARHKWFDRFLTLLPYICLVFVVVFFIIETKGRILLPVNINNIVGQMIVILLVAMGSLFIYAQGELDISIGPTLGISCLAATLVIMHVTDNLLVIALVCIVTSMAVKLLIGFLIARFRLPVFLATLIIKVILTAALSYLCLAFNTSTSGESSGISIPGSSPILQFDTLWVRLLCSVIVFVVMLYLLRYKRLGKYCKALGGNVKCSVQSGVNRGKYMIYAFLFSGFATGLASLVYILRVRQVSATTGNGIELSVIIAIVIGGMSLNGGAKTRALAPVVGAIVYAILDYGLIMIQVPSGIIQAIRGGVFLLMIGLMNINTKVIELPR